MNTETRNVRARQSDQMEKMQERPTVAPAVDIYENADEVLLIADMPGVLTDQITVNLEKGQLTIEGRRTPKEQQVKLATEFRVADYRRIFAVPAGINAEKIDAELRNGVLRVHLPKSSALKPRQIPVRSS